MAVTPSFNAGTLIVVQATFSNDGVAADPGSVVVKFRAQTGIDLTTWEYGVTGNIVKVGTGVYAISIDTTGAGGFLVGEWIGTAPVQVTQPFNAQIQPLPL